MKYKELIREAARNEETLIDLESQYREVELISAKKEEPWELITKPTLLNSPVAPSRRSIALKSILFGLILGSAFAFLRERNLGLIYDSEILNKFFPLKIISKMELKTNYEKDKEFLFLMDFLEKNSTSTISFLLLEGLESKELETFKNGIKKNKLNFYKNLKDINSNQVENSKYLILKLGFTKISELINLRKYKKLFNYEFQGIILFEDSNSKSIGNIDDKIKLKSKFIYSYLSNKFANSKSIKAVNNKIKIKCKSIFSNFSNFLSNLFKK